MKLLNASASFCQGSILSTLMAAMVTVVTTPLPLTEHLVLSSVAQDHTYSSVLPFLPPEFLSNTSAAARCKNMQTSTIETATLEKTAIVHAVFMNSVYQRDQLKSSKSIKIQCNARMLQYKLGRLPWNTKSVFTGYPKLHTSDAVLRFYAFYTWKCQGGDSFLITSMQHVSTIYS